MLCTPCSPHLDCPSTSFSPAKFLFLIKPGTDVTSHGRLILHPLPRLHTALVHCPTHCTVSPALTPNQSGGSLFLGPVLACGIVCAQESMMGWCVCVYVCGILLVNSESFILKFKVLDSSISRSFHKPVDRCCFIINPKQATWLKGLKVSASLALLMDLEGWLKPVVSEPKPRSSISMSHDEPSPPRQHHYPRLKCGIRSHSAVMVLPSAVNSTHSTPMFQQNLNWSNIPVRLFNSFLLVFTSLNKWSLSCLMSFTARSRSEPAFTSFTFSSSRSLTLASSSRIFASFLSFKI